MSNISGPGQGQFMSVTELGVTSAVTTVLCVLCLWVNGLLLWTLRSKAMFRETPRYSLLSCLLLADTLHLSLSQLLYLFAASHTMLLFPLCAFITLLVEVANEVSPLTVMLMSLERYVAVCLPLRHGALLGGRRATVAVLLLWALSMLNSMVRVGLLMQFPFHTLDTLMLSDYCSSEAIKIAPLSAIYDEGYIYFVFVFSTLVILWSYVMVMTAAHRCASEQSVKARNTMMLHMLQLVFCMCATIYMPMIMAIARSRTLKRLTFVRVQNTLYVLIMILPRCLSVLIYGIKDQTIRATLLTILCRKHKTQPRE
ncbi:unnamed protein product [Knipowitschia caucasica]|uniref:G-protein coupled receptors family 1 profile domain-containing protein n=1 Tax=Knipowitschia caucasica TaxID=637954 RepID=A0AAV2J9T4_KNICA